MPLIVPVTLINHYVSKYRADYLARQHYLSPTPSNLNCAITLEAAKQ